VVWSCADTSARGRSATSARAAADID